MTYKYFRDDITGEATRVICVCPDKIIYLSEGTSNWSAYQEWLAEGNEPLPADN